MKYRFRLPILVSGIMLATALALLVPTTSSYVHAQSRSYRHDGGRYYQPYGQGSYGRHGRGYAAPARSHYSMYPSRGGMYGGRNYRYSPNRNVPLGYGNGFDIGIGPIRVYGRSSYYQPSYGPVYGPFGYSDY